MTHLGRFYPWTWSSGKNEGRSFLFAYIIDRTCYKIALEKRSHFHFVQHAIPGGLHEPVLALTFSLLRMHVLFPFSYVVLTSCFCLSTVLSHPTATIKLGVVIGTAVTLPTATATVNQFLGIPFAQSPPERFSPPVAPKPWSKPLKATSWKPACIQQFNCKHV